MYNSTKYMANLLIGSPRRKKPSKGNNVSTKSNNKTTSKVAFFSKEHVELIQKLISQSSFSSSVVATGNTAEEVHF